MDQIKLLLLGPLMGAVLTAPPAGKRDGLPVGGQITGALETRALHKGLDQHGTVAVTRLPIVAQSGWHPTQQVAGQVGDFDVRQDQKPAVVDHQMQVLASNPLTPTKPLLAPPQPDRKSTR